MQQLADDKQVQAITDRLADWAKQQIASSDARSWAAVGIRSRGDELARRIASQASIDRVGTLDITLYRDDLSELSNQPVVRTTDIDFSIDGLDVILVDDVLMTGRSIRAALQSLMDFGRPRRVWLMVMVDRGGRELPIAADVVGLEHVTDGNVQVLLKPEDERDVILLEPAA
jgi:pyrimidine operon attenuation protein/uracil phosphoribosyltransferase